LAQALADEADLPPWRALAPRATRLIEAGTTALAGGVPATGAVGGAAGGGRAGAGMGGGAVAVMSVDSGGATAGRPAFPLAAVQTLLRRLVAHEGDRLFCWSDPAAARASQSDAFPAESGPVRSCRLVGSKVSDAHRAPAFFFFFWGGVGGARARRTGPHWCASRGRWSLSWRCGCPSALPTLPSPGSSSMRRGTGARPCTGSVAHTHTHTHTWWHGMAGHWCGKIQPRWCMCRAPWATCSPATTSAAISRSCVYGPHLGVRGGRG
jgi:hypothetical protein